MAGKTRDAYVIAAVPCVRLDKPAAIRSHTSSTGDWRIAERSLSARTSSDERH